MTQATSSKRLSLVTLAAVLHDERHGGWGYATSRHLARSKRDRLDRAVVAVANELGLDYEGLFTWANSKAGRWCVDGATGRYESPTRETVRRYLNAEEMARLS